MTQALELAAGVKAAHQAALGDDHPNTLVAANNQGCYLWCLGQLPEALELTEDTLHRMRGKLGDRHPLTLPSTVNLANCQGDSGNHESAAALERETAVALRDVLGPDHPDTLACLANLTVSLHQAGRGRKPATFGPGSTRTSAASSARTIRTRRACGLAGESTGTWKSRQSSWPAMAG